MIHFRLGNLHECLWFSMIDEETPMMVAIVQRDCVTENIWPLFLFCLFVCWFLFPRWFFFVAAIMKQKKEKKYKNYRPRTNFICVCDTLDERAILVTVAAMAAVVAAARQHWVSLSRVHLEPYDRRYRRYRCFSYNSILCVCVCV